MAPPQLRGAALGSYNTLQSLGLFAGGALGGALVKWAGAPGLFAATTVLTALWLVLTWPLRPVGRGGHRVVDRAMPPELPLRAGCGTMARLAPGILLQIRRFFHPFKAKTAPWHP